MNTPNSIKNTIDASRFTLRASQAKARTESMLLNVGPSHPAMHGIVRIIAELDGERVVNSDVEIGYLHRAFEKSSELGGYLQVIPYTDRLNYVSPLINNVGYCLAVEKLFGLEITERAKYIRVVMSEISRVTDHLTCIGASAMELGAFTVFLYMIKAREYLYELIEQVTGARLTISYTRIGGVKGDLPTDFEGNCRNAIRETRKVLKEVDGLLTRNRIFVDRMEETGVISKEDALAYGITGPFLRSTGMDYDVRRANPYLVYDRFDFDIPVGEHGDNYDRYLCRMEEMEQSMRIVEQALDQMPPGPVLLDTEGNVIPAEEMVDEGKMGRIENIAGRIAAVDPTLEGTSKPNAENVQAANKRAVLPPKEDTYRNIEGLMNHFKMIMMGHGIRPPKGEVYFPVEGANGELGFYVVSDGTDKPYRVRVRPPCFVIMAALPLMINGGMMADIVPTFGSVNMIGGELDR
jgi:NADH-quinone oxidoreductase subunit D